VIQMALASPHPRPRPPPPPPPRRRRGRAENEIQRGVEARAKYGPRARRHVYVIGLAAEKGVSRSADWSAALARSGARALAIPYGLIKWHSQAPLVLVVVVVVVVDVTSRSPFRRWRRTARNELAKGIAQKGAARGRLLLLQPRDVAKLTLSL